MKDFEIVQNFFGSMQCTKCRNHFEPEGIILVREEENFFVVNITCVKCNQQVGIAIVGVASKLEEYAHILDEEIYYEEQEEQAAPISYDEVIEAHHFIQNLGSDWMKYIDKK